MGSAQIQLLKAGRGGSLILTTAVILLVLFELAFCSYYPNGQDPENNYPQQHQRKDHQPQPMSPSDEEESNNSNSDCLIPCGHIYDPVCGVSYDDNSSDEEVRLFPNECTMNRINCETNKRYRVVESEKCDEKTDLADPMFLPSSASPSVRMPF